MKKVIKTYTSDETKSPDKLPSKVASLAAYNHFLVKKCGSSFDFDEQGETNSTIKEGWTGMRAVWGVAIAGGGLAVAKKLGVDILNLGAQSNLLIALKAAAAGAGGINLVSWMTNPSKDLDTLNEWLSTPQNQHKPNNNQTLLIWLQMLLVSAICISALIDPILFGAFAAFTYIMNCIGFSIIIGKVEKAVADAREICDQLGPDEAKPFLHEAFECIANWWGTTGQRRTFFRNPMQLRHFALIVAFLIVAGLGIAGRLNHAEIYYLVAYSIGAVALLGAVISISVMRSKRQDKLSDIESRWSKTVHGLIKASKPVA